MRRAAITVLLGLTLASCAAPAFSLRARFVRGEVRTYRLVADARVRITAERGSTLERTRLVADTRIRVEDLSGGTATLALTITPRALTRNGKRADPPPEQQIRITVTSQGRVTAVTPAGDEAVELAAADVEDLVPLIGPPLPEGRVHLADTWTRRQASTQGAPAGTQEARLAALRIVNGFDCAVVAVSTRRPVVREREVGGAPLRLEGVEFAAGEISFAFRQGLPVTVRSDAEARLAISGGTAPGGAVVILTTTTITLVRRTLP